MFGRIRDAAQSGLWTREVQFTLRSEDIPVKVCYPLAPARGEIEVAYRRLNLRSDGVPIELWIFIDDVCRRIVAKLFVQADLFKFVKESVCLSQIVRIAELPDKISSPQQQSLFFDQVILRGYSIRKPSVFDCSGNSRGVNFFGSVEALGD